jgi:hypothetical protein
MHDVGNRTSFKNCVPRIKLRHLIKSKILKLNLFFMFLHPTMLECFIVHKFVDKIQSILRVLNGQSDKFSVEKVDQKYTYQAGQCSSNACI